MKLKKLTELFTVFHAVSLFLQVPYWK